MERLAPIFIIWILSILPYSAEAQTGSISGVISDSLLNPVELARIEVIGTLNAAITNSDGTYLIDNINPGIYDLSINHSEFHRAIIASVEIIEDSTTGLSVELEPPQTGIIAHAYMVDDEIWMPVDINNNIAVGEFDFLIRWLPDYLTLESVYSSDRTNYGNLVYIIDDAGPGTVRVHWDTGTNDPMPGGSGPVIYLHFQADSTLYHCQIMPVYFTGSQIDCAVYDSSGQQIILDNLFGGSIIYESTGHGCMDPDWNGWTLDIGDIIIVKDRLIYGYGVWKINPPLQELMADLNNNGFVDAADLIILLNLIHGYSTENYPVLTFLTDVDPYERDAFIVGNLDGSPVIGYPGQTVEIPVFIRTDEEIESFVLRLSTDTSRVSERLGTELTPVLNGWSIDLGPEFNFQPGFCGQTAIAYVDSGGPLNTNSQWSDAIAYFNLRLADYGFGGGESIQLKARANIVDSNYVVYQPLIIEGSILVEIADCFYIYGDANSDSVFNGLDVIYSVYYFKGQVPSVPTECYCGIHGLYGANADSNGDCIFNGLDIVYSVAALKGTGPMPMGCPDCPPE